jgi:cation:H+ antiporter
LNRRQRGVWAAFVFAAVGAHEIAHVPATTALWATPAILLAAMMIAWAAESAQFFISQGFALAILAWLQTLPEFAVEAVLAWRQQVPFLLANLTGALRLLTGLGWPLIYFTAAFFYRRKHGKPMGSIVLEDEQAVEVMGLLVPLVYMIFVWAKGYLSLYDSAVLVAMYVAYIWILSKMPPQEPERIDDLDRVPKTVVQSRPAVRNFLIAALFLGGGALIYYAAEPFLGSLFALSSMLGISSFVFIQWVAPFVSEFPEKVSAFYWAKTIDRAPMALMNMVSSNINQWTLLPAMLVVIYSISAGQPSVIPLDERHRLELLMTIGQSLVGMIFLVNMALSWWEAAALFGLWFVQFVLSPVEPGPGMFRAFAGHIHWIVTIMYFVWFGAELIHIAAGKRIPAAFWIFRRLWREHVRGGALH